jgi:hypothetical protein
MNNFVTHVLFYGMVNLFYTKLHHNAINSKFLIQIYA